MRVMSGRQPIFNIPASVVAVALALGVLHAVRAVLPPEQSQAMLLALAFIPARYAALIPQLPGGEWSAVTSFISYMFVHGDATHLIINTVWMLAFGSAIAKRVGNLRFLVFSALCGVAGALVHLGLHFGELVPVVGASAAISGQMAGALRFIFGAPGTVLFSSQNIQSVPLASIRDTLKDRRFLLFLGVWMALNLLFGLDVVQFNDSGGGIAWEAHIGGFLCGFVAIGVFDRASRRDKRPHFES